MAWQLSNCGSSCTSAVPYIPIKRAAVAHATKFTNFSLLFRASGQLGLNSPALLDATNAITILVSEDNQCVERVSTVMAGQFIFPGPC